MVVPAIDTVVEVATVLVEAPSTSGASTSELVAELSSGIAVVDVAVVVVVASNGNVSLAELPAAVGAAAPAEAAPDVVPSLALPTGVMTAGVDVSAVVLAGDGSVEVPSSIGVELPVEGELVEELSTTGVGNVEVDTIGVVDPDDVASDDGGYQYER